MKTTLKKLWHILTGHRQNRMPAQETKVDRCICCGEPIPEGRCVCWRCEHEGGSNVKDYESTEIAYKNGYTQGKKDAVKYGRWRNERCVIYCTNCGRGYRITNGGPNILKFNYCPNCGSKMDLEG